MKSTRVKLNVAKVQEFLDKSSYRGNAKALSLDLGRNETFIRDVATGRSKGTDSQTAAKMAKLLAVKFQDIVDGSVMNLAPPPGSRRGVIPARTRESRMTDENLYTIYMVGDSMEPRYEQGWLLYVDPIRPPLKGHDVVVYTEDAVLVRRLVRQTETELVLEQLNPIQETLIPASDVQEIHLVVGSEQ